MKHESFITLVKVPVLCIEQYRAKFSGSTVPFSLNANHKLILQAKNASADSKTFPWDTYLTHRICVTWLEPAEGSEYVLKCLFVKIWDCLRNYWPTQKKLLQLSIDKFRPLLSHWKSLPLEICHNNFSHSQSSYFLSITSLTSALFYYWYLSIFLSSDINLSLGCYLLT